MNAEVRTDKIIDPYMNFLEIYSTVSATGSLHRFFFLNFFY